MKNNNNKPKKFKFYKLFGRNIFTILFIVVTVLLITFIVYTITSYTSVSKKTKVTPFVTQSYSSESGTSNFEDGTYYTKSDKTTKVKKANGKSFDDLGIIFKCTKYDETDTSNISAKYQLRVYDNGNDDKLTSTTKITANVLVTANWIGCVNYSSKTTTLQASFAKTETSTTTVTDTPDSTETTENDGVKTTIEIKDGKKTTTTVTSAKKVAEKSTSSTYYKDFSVSSLPNFPAKAKTFPIKVKVNTPTIYLYLEYTYKEDGLDKKQVYILKYTYDEITDPSTFDENNGHGIIKSN